MVHADTHPDGGPRGLRLALQAMGTRFELVLAGEMPERDLRAAGEEALVAVREWHDRLSAFERGSVVGLINAEAYERPVRIDREMLELLLACRKWHGMTSGAFDVALGSLMARHGFRDEPAQEEPPPFGMAHLEINGARSEVRLTAPGVRLDFGAVGKGWAIDRALDSLREAGVTSALLHGGTSTVGTIGADPSGEPWRVRLEESQDAPVAVLRDASLSVSATSGRRNAKGEGHVLDPRSGSPSSRVRLAAVIGVYSAETDALSTALLVLGERPGSIPADVVSILSSQTPDPGRWAIGGDAAGQVEFQGQSRKGGGSDEHEA